MLIDHADALAETISADFGHRAKQEVLLSEIWMAKEEIDDALKHGKRWMKPIRKPMNKWLRPARAKVMPQPLGVVGIVVPWNYPVLLAAGPLICALAAGNRAIIKMSELTPRTSALFEQLIAKTFTRDHVAVVNGDAEVGAAFSGLPFDHLLFTGSTRRPPRDARSRRQPHARHARTRRQVAGDRRRTRASMQRSTRSSRARR